MVYPFSVPTRGLKINYTICHDYPVFVKEPEKEHAWKNRLALFWPQAREHE
jgi:hypothetical protein